MRKPKRIYYAHISDVKNPTIPDRDRDVSGIYPGDQVKFDIVCPRYNNGLDSRGPWMCKLTWPNELSAAIDGSGVDEGTAALLYGLVMAIRPRMVLETGTHKGRSTQAIASALVENDQGHVWTVDMDDYGVLDKALDESERKRVTQVIGRTPGIFDEAPLKDLDGIDFAFLDGDHTGKALLADLDFVDRHRARTCYVVIDNAMDTGWIEIRQVMDEYRKYPHIVIETMCGLELVFMHGSQKNENQNRQDEQNAPAE